VRERARARAAIWLAGPDHDHVVTSLMIMRVTRARGCFLYRRHREVNFNWSGKQSLSTGVGLKNRGGREGQAGSFAPLNESPVRRCCLPLRSSMSYSVYRFIGVWQQDSGKDHGLATVQRTAYPT